MIDFKKAMGSGKMAEAYQHTAPPPKAGGDFLWRLSQATGIPIETLAAMAKSDPKKVAVYATRAGIEPPNDLPTDPGTEIAKSEAPPASANSTGAKATDSEDSAPSVAPRTTTPATGAGNEASRTPDTGPAHDPDAPVNSGGAHGAGGSDYGAALIAALSGVKAPAPPQMGGGGSPPSPHAIQAIDLLDKYQAPPSAPITQPVRLRERIT